MISLYRKQAWWARAALIVTALACAFGAGHAAAQDSIQPDENILFHDAMLAYRLGNYYRMKGDYERAVEYLSEAITLMPDWAFYADTGYADMHWTLGEALESSGRYSEALVHYRRFLALVGDEAAPWTVKKVEAFAASFGAQA